MGWDEIPALGWDGMKFCQLWDGMVWDENSENFGMGWDGMKNFKV